MQETWPPHGRNRNQERAKPVVTSSEDLRRDENSVVCFEVRAQIVELGVIPVRDVKVELNCYTGISKGVESLRTVLWKC